MKTKFSFAAMAAFGFLVVLTSSASAIVGKVPAATERASLVDLVRGCHRNVRRHNGRRAHRHVGRNCRRVNARRFRRDRRPRDWRLRGCLQVGPLFYCP